MSEDGWSVLPLVHGGISMMSFGWLGKRTVARTCAHDTPGTGQPIWSADDEVHPLP